MLRLGADMLTIHAYPKAMAAAVGAARGSSLCLLGVTALTSMDDGDLKDAGYSMDARALVSLRAAQARDAGMGGIVCSAAGGGTARTIVGPKLAIVTPGIRPASSAAISTPDDQKRVMTPGQAISAGASHIVVGRPITAASDPLAAARNIVNEMLIAAGRS